MRSGLDEDITPVGVHVHARSIIKDDIRCAGIEEPEPPRLGLCMSADHPEQRIVEAILGGADDVTARVGVQREGQGRVGREHRRDARRD